MSEEELNLLTSIWESVFHTLSDNDFLRAVEICLRQERFFPSPATVLQAHREAAPKAMPLYILPQDEHTPEELHRNAVNGAMLRRSVQQGGEEAKLFFRMDSWEHKDKLARALLGNTYPAYPDPRQREEKDTQEGTPVEAKAGKGSNPEKDSRLVGEQETGKAGMSTNDVDAPVEGREERGPAHQPWRPAFQPEPSSLRGHVLPPGS